MPNLSEEEIIKIEVAVENAISGMDMDDLNTYAYDSMLDFYLEKATDDEITYLFEMFNPIEDGDEEEI